MKIEKYGNGQVKTIYCDCGESYFFTRKIRFGYSHCSACDHEFHNPLLSDSWTNDCPKCGEDLMKFNLTK